MYAKRDSRIARKILVEAALCEKRRFCLAKNTGA